MGESLLFNPINDSFWNSATVVSHLSGDNNSGIWLMEREKKNCVLKKEVSPYDCRKEVYGLQKLAEVIPQSVPKIYEFGENHIVMEFCEPVNPSKKNWMQAGEYLARFHRWEADHWGLDHDNFIGRSRQVNTPQEHFMTTSWGDFYLKTKILPQWNRAVESNIIPQTYTKFWHDIQEGIIGLPSFSERPSLLHGDLWSSNLLFSVNGPVFIDPSVHFGHREFDFAMISMFGGFEDDFFHGYDEVYPRHEGFEERLPFYELYHWLNHVNIFGESYMTSLSQCLDKVL